jgi:hypothetical protein
MDIFIYDVIHNVLSFLYIDLGIKVLLFYLFI